MRLYNIVSEILVILPIIDFAVTAPLLAQEKLQARINVVHISAHAWKRADDSELEELGVKLFNHPKSHFVSKPEELPAAHPPSSSPPSEGPMEVDQPLIIGHPKSHSFAKPLPSISEEPPQGSSSDRAQLRLLNADDLHGLMKI